ncbi:FAD-dependent monooxygenase [Streptomyces paludis]|uniref:FAD-dependent monooxygenase n=1 Tax=Streptomyces paludis TaxID=2282738 RepID=UPI001E644381|nr:FAD-dependent monooxygenase [Streptomyces paludis]
MADVIVVGAGPSGLLLAGDLAAAGHSVTLVERRAERVGNLTRALVVHARTLELLDARGLADELVACGNPVRKARLPAGGSLDLSRLRSRFPFILVVGQYEVERLLERRAREAGVGFLYGTEVTGLRQDADGVEVDVDAAADAAEPDEGAGARPGRHRRTLLASYAVGADGASSIVRRTLGLPFPGSAVISSMVLADVRLAEEPPAPILADADAEGGTFALIATFGDGWYRVMSWSRDRQLPDSAPAGLDEVRENARRALGSDYGMHSPRWISRFHSDERQVPHYRVGRVFLAGDAAHVHSPAGGLGMNTGLQDSANLSWKLSAVLGGRAGGRVLGDALLDTYDSERHPVGAAALRASGTLIRLALTGSRPLRGLLTAGARLVAHAHPVTDRALTRVSGIGIAYPAPRGAHPLTGRRAPDLVLRGTPGRLYEALRAGRFVLVGPAGNAAVRESARESVRPDGPVLYAESARNSHRTLLIRPDGHIAWASNHPDPSGLRRALTEWGLAGSHS